MRDKTFDPFISDCFLMTGAGLVTIIDAFHSMEGEPMLELHYIDDDGEDWYSILTLLEWRIDVIPLIESVV